MKQIMSRFNVTDDEEDERFNFGRNKRKKVKILRYWKITKCLLKT